MRKETCGWLGIFCILALWIWGVVYFALDVKKELFKAMASIERLQDNNSRLQYELSGVAAKAEQIKSSIAHLKSSIPPKTVVVNRDGCVPEECLARALLIVQDLRRTFALGAMTSDSVSVVKPVLTALNDQGIDDSLRVIEKFHNRKGYRELREEFYSIRNELNFGPQGAMWQLVSKWVSVKDRNSQIWRDYVDLENLMRAGDWEGTLEFGKSSTLSAVPRVKRWLQDLEFVLEIEAHLFVIYDKLVERVHKNPEGI
ncbi:hypothetical protein ANPL_04535 [Anaplasma platys]|uniref:Uncharacterized protein n=1 Tax=Anaplasma platys TaxID=949 RepID=A0A858PZF9_9RICK|nr:hypothetical protein [Anaplasma platys]QJC27950.1 hypothetical protein ANPL_04535 [Anaplasma platys]